MALNNCRDTDMIYFSDTKKRENEDGVHFMRWTSSEANAVLNLWQQAPQKPYRIFYFLYQLGKEFHKEENYPIPWSLSNWPRIWLTNLQTLVNFRPQESYFGVDGNLRKIAYHLAYQYFMLAENKVWLDGESKAIVQKIHDGKMPNSYFHELRDKINSLKIEE